MEERGHLFEFEPFKGGPHSRGYIYLEASLKLRDDDPGPTDYLVTSSGEEKVSIAVDYTIILW